MQALQALLTASPSAASGRRQGYKPIRCQAAPSSALEAPASQQNATLERAISGAAAGPRPSSAAAGSSTAAATLRAGRRGLHSVPLAPGGVLTSDIIARATGASSVTDEGYHPINRVAYQVCSNGCCADCTCVSSLSACHGFHGLFHSRGHENRTCLPARVTGMPSMLRLMVCLTVAAGCPPSCAHCRACPAHTARWPHSRPARDGSRCPASSLRRPSRRSARWAGSRAGNGTDRKPQLCRSM